MRILNELEILSNAYTYLTRRVQNVIKNESMLIFLDILFSSNHNIHKSSCGLYFWSSDPLINRFY